MQEVEEFSAWIEAHGFAGMQKSVRSVAIELAENVEAIERGGQHCLRGNAAGSCIL
jgi:hypothetical protein